MAMQPCPFPGLPRFNTEEYSWQLYECSIFVIASYIEGAVGLRKANDRI